MRRYYEVTVRVPIDIERVMRTTRDQVGAPPGAIQPADVEQFVAGLVAMSLGVIGGNRLCTEMIMLNRVPLAS